jgi:hypothetical protein
MPSCVGVAVIVSMAGVATAMDQVIGNMATALAPDAIVTAGTPKIAGVALALDHADHGVGS